MFQDLWNWFIFGGWVEGPSKQTDSTDGGWVQSTFGAKAEQISLVRGHLAATHFYKWPNTPFAGGFEIFNTHFTFT